MADDALASAVLGASEVALFENLYAAYARMARDTARAFLADTELAADAVHNGYLEILRQILAGRRWQTPDEARAAVYRNVRWASLTLCDASGSSAVHCRSALMTAPLPSQRPAAPS
jgi:hypothetical protein